MLARGGTVIDALRADHDELAALFDRLAIHARNDRRTLANGGGAWLKGGADDLARTAAQLVVAARVHMVGEERVVYPALLAATGPLKSFALGGPHEHETLDITLDKLLVRHTLEEYRVLIQVAYDLFEMHARDEEEGEALPRVVEAMSAAQLVALGEQLRAEQARIRPAVEWLVSMPAPRPGNVLATA